MGLFENLKSTIQNHFDKNKEEREVMEKIQKEVETERLLVFKETFKKNALEVAKSKALRDAAEKSGLQKLRQINRARNLSKDQVAPDSVFGKFKDFTQKNIANREENLKKTAMMREAARKMMEERQGKLLQRRSPGGQRRPFSHTTWKM